MKRVAMVAALLLAGVARADGAFIDGGLEQVMLMVGGVVLATTIVAATGALLLWLGVRAPKAEWGKVAGGSALVAIGGFGLVTVLSVIDDRWWVVFDVLQFFVPAVLVISFGIGLWRMGRAVMSAKWAFVVSVLGAGVARADGLAEWATLAISTGVLAVMVVGLSLVGSVALWVSARRHQSRPRKVAAGALLFIAVALGGLLLLVLLPIPAGFLADVGTAFVGVVIGGAFIALVVWVVSRLTRDTEAER